MSLENNGDDDAAPSPVVFAAILEAARDTGVDPNVLMAFAWRESRYRPDAKSSRSSARGLLQFTPTTWLETVRDFGRQYGAPEYAAAIHTGRSGHISISGFQTRQHILMLRGDPAFSARMAAAAMARQALESQRSMGRSATSAELYLSHVLGPEGSARFLTARARHPSESCLEIASLELLYNAGLLADDGRPMTVENTYVAVDIMLKRHPVRQVPDLGLGQQAGQRETNDRDQYGRGTPAAINWCSASTLVICQRSAVAIMMVAR